MAFLESIATDGCGSRQRSWRTRTLLGALLLLGSLFVLVCWGGRISQSLLPTSAIWPPELAFAADPSGDYAFFPYRRDVWIVCHSKGTAQFFHSPESTTKEQPLVKSRVYTIDRALFPQDQVRFLISERNLTNYLWIVNPVTGNSRFIRARRDGGFDESPIIDAAKEL